MTQAEKLLHSLTLKEKCSLLSGATFWETAEIKRLKLPSVWMADGPHGLRKQLGKNDRSGIGESVPATCFPPACTLAATWSPDLARQMGAAIGEECQQNGVSLLLGPGINLKRSPLCGRNFEYYAEDPYLTGEMASGFIKGLQSQGVGACVKHFAVNNQEDHRMRVDSVVDDRALHELYLSAFERVVKEAKPWAVMCSYNRLFGTYCSENHWLLTTLLRDRWGFGGLTVTDWGACNDRVKGLKAGMELEMPTSSGLNTKKLLRAVQKGELSVSTIDAAALSVLRFVCKGVENRRPETTFSKTGHHALAREIAAEGTVLLKNEDAILPLKKGQKVAIVGALAQSPRYQGAGSSAINPTKLVSSLEAFETKGISYPFAQGYRLDSDEADGHLEREALALAKEAEVTVVFAGLPALFEAESFDRRDLSLPENQNALISKLSAVTKNIVVVLSLGAPVTMPWIQSVKGVLCGYLGGQAGGEALAELLLGEKCPLGKLPETFPLALEDTPCFETFGAGPYVAEYRESVFVGYRYYEAAQKKVLFPFGHGLSYTTFACKLLACERQGNEIAAKVLVRNVGERAGAEVVQLYVGSHVESYFHPDKELRRFEKVYLEPGCEKEIDFTVGAQDLAHFSGAANAFVTEPGRYSLYFGTSSADIFAEELVAYPFAAGAGESDLPHSELVERPAAAASYYNRPVGPFTGEAFAAIYGRAIPENRPAPRETSDGKRPRLITEDSTVDEIKDLGLGKLIYKLAVKAQSASPTNTAVEEANRRMSLAMLGEMPLHSGLAMSGVPAPPFAIKLLYWHLDRCARKKERER